MKQKRVIIVIFIALQWLLLQAALEVPVSREPVLEESNMLTGFVRLYPDDKLPETPQSKAWIWQNDNKLMVHCEVSVDSLFTPGPLAFRDRASNADYIRVQITTLQQAHYSYNYQAFPNGNLMDFIRQEDMNTDYNWNSTYGYETSYDDETWQITMTIPLSELRFKQKLPYTWKIVLTRYIHKTEEFYSLPYANTEAKRDYFTMGQDIVLTQHVSRNLNISLMPYFVKSYDLITKESSFDPDNIGLDLAYSPGHRTRIKVALNPDFSDVPPDDAQDIYNSKYLPYYDENRFFFIEDIDALGVDGAVFYSRNIAQPSIAFKINGVAGTSNWGVLGALDKKITDNGDIINRDDYYQILSYIPTIKKLTLANAIVSRVNDGYYNHVYSGKYYWYPLKNLALQTNLILGVRKDEAVSDELQKGFQSYVTLSYFPKNWNFMVAAFKISKDLFMDAGYMRDKDYEMLRVIGTWNSPTYKGFVKNLNLTLSADSQEFHPERDSLYVRSFTSGIFVTTQSKLSLGIAADYSNPLDFNDQNHDTYLLSGRFTSYKREALSYSVHASRAKSLVYRLNDTFDQNMGSLSIWGALSKALSYRLDLVAVRYDYPEILQGLVDDSYEIINGKLQYMPNRQVSLSSGIGISTYESAGTYANLSYYGNLRYEFRPDYFLFLGFKSNQDQSERPNSDNILGRYIKNSATAYLKLSVKI